MENGVEALKLASSVLIFVVAIAITISVFTFASQALNRIFDMQSGDEYVKDANGDFLNFVRFDDNGTREVGIETMIPSIYRAYKENYAIYFYESNGDPLVLYETNKNGEMVGVNYIDLEKEVHGNAESAIEKINDLLYKTSENFSNGLYQYLKGKTFTESLGEYYMDDLSAETETAEVNKIKKRVITYKEN